ISVYTLSLHDALPIYLRKHSDLITPALNRNHWPGEFCWRFFQFLEPGPGATLEWVVRGKSLSVSRYWEKPQLSISRCLDRRRSRSEEHTSELQSRVDL